MKPRAEEPQVLQQDDAATTDLSKVFDPDDIMAAVNRAVTAALRRHKELGQSVVVWRDGKIVTLKPEEIDV